MTNSLLIHNKPKIVSVVRKCIPLYGHLSWLTGRHRRHTDVKIVPGHTVICLERLDRESNHDR
jgi:hypothetical protein